MALFRASVCSIGGDTGFAFNQSVDDVTAYISRREPIAKTLKGCHNELLSRNGFGSILDVSHGMYRGGKERKMADKWTVGLDIGSVSVGLVLLDEGENIACQDYRFHRGRLRDTLQEMLEALPVKEVTALGVVAEKGREFLRAGIEVNEQVAIISGVKKKIADVRMIISIGGETFGLIIFDESGRYHKFISNSACAAGTGSFLDQQASRLKLSGSAELSRLAATYTHEPPRIATRCAVFAKTDLIHLQQQGYGVPAIAAGLCHGMAENIVDTLFSGVEIVTPIVAVGGVSLNDQVIRSLENILGVSIERFEGSELAGAMGAAVAARKHAGVKPPDRPIDLRTVVSSRTIEKTYGYPPIEISSKQDDDKPWKTFTAHETEIEIFRPLKEESVRCLLGIDIGSTSTKAVITNTDNEPLVGLYTRTSGRPVAAVQKLTRCIGDIEERFHVGFEIAGAGTTGSGRKFIQKVCRADYCVDEITAHARAAYHLRPEIDTIIEIGGQDAKFTVMRRGNVTFSVMNYVCAAGTGSFLEEQAKRLGVSLEDFERLAVGVPAPYISNRCTVFMERDLNHLLSLGYDRRELLAAALHSVRDNYLSKVAHRNKIGSHIAFQGATARNRALVAAFEMSLKKKIYVSPLCHLTGALGVCLKMADTLNLERSGFRKDIHNDTIHVDEYVCTYCNNHCKIKTINIQGETVGWGYLCGRDETVQGYRRRSDSAYDLLSRHRKVFDISGADHAVAKKFEEINVGGIQSIIRKPGFSLARLRNRIQFNVMEMRNELFSSGVISKGKPEDTAADVTIGLPGSLTMLEYQPLWKLFFRLLGFKTVVSSPDKSDIRQGRSVRGAEYCAPLTEFHGQMLNLTGRSDYIFYPQVIETQMDGLSKSYCYYTQYAIPIVSNIPGLDIADKIIAPVLKLTGEPEEIIRRIYLSFPDALKKKTTYNRIESAFELSWDWFTARKKALKELFQDQFGATNDIAVALLGRPYIVLNKTLNKGIPDMLADKGIQTFYMDMLPLEQVRIKAAGDFLAWNHWHYGDIIMRAAEMVAQSDNLFPIYMTAFKCSPDSFILAYFKEIMNYYEKPYLVLQVDDHEAGEGYESRIEAAIETFRSYRPSQREAAEIPSVRIQRRLEQKTYLIPDYDRISTRLIQGAFEHAGIPVFPVEQTSETIARSLQLNDGQCLPVSIIAQGIAYTIDKHGLDPEKTAFYINSDCHLSCNLPQYPVMIKQTLEKMGDGLDKVSVLVSRFLPDDFPLGFRLDFFLAYMVSGLLQKMTHRLRPRAANPEEVDVISRDSVEKMYRTFRDGGSKEAAFQEIVRAFASVKRVRENLPQVGIVGDLYVRDNDVFNQDLVREIEKNGSEAVTIPFVDSLKILSELHFLSQWDSGRYLHLLKTRLVYNTLNFINNRLNAMAKDLLGEPEEITGFDPRKILQTYHFSTFHGGESAENLLKIFYLKKTCPNLRLILNVNPLFCCPGLISEALYKKVEKDIGVPIVSITYDGTQSGKNRLLQPYLSL